MAIQRRRFPRSRSSASSDRIRFSFSIFCIGILHCLVWSLGVSEAYSQTFFSHTTGSLKSGGALSSPYSEEEYQQITRLAALFSAEEQEFHRLQQERIRRAAEVESSRLEKHRALAVDSRGDRGIASGPGAIHIFKSVNQQSNRGAEEAAEPAKETYITQTNSFYANPKLLLNIPNPTVRAY